MLKIIVLILALISIITCGLSTIESNEWWIRIWDFPRMQLFIIGLIVLIAYIVFSDFSIWTTYLIVLFLITSLVYQFIQIIPFTPIYPKEVLQTDNYDKGSSISVFVANVLMKNRNYQELLNLIDENNPDIFLSVETDEWWKEKLDEIEHEYRYSVKIPQKNTYGMLLYSKLELIEPEVRYLIEKDVPSVTTKVKLRNGEIIKLYCLHPSPPRPIKRQDSDERDAELLTVAKEIKDDNLRTIVAGDLNDVAWSHTTRLFRRISKTLDPRIGRGMYNTYNAKLPILRWPLDHIFHSRDFKLNQIIRISSFGSDHFPIYIDLSYTPSAITEQEKPEHDQEDLEDMEEIIEDG